ncbi:hypothetical protein Mapa_009641 [Marchantia paleacea]|nr:hypothetical protein Mapa_009641 [Marchantia paleacea]
MDDHETHLVYHGSCWHICLPDCEKNFPEPIEVTTWTAKWTMGSELHRVLADHTKKYGPLLYFKLGSLPIVIVSSADVAEELFRHKDVEFASRAHSTILYSSATYFGFGASNMGFAGWTPTLKQIRKVCTTELLTVAKLSNSEHVKCLTLEQFHRDSCFIVFYPISASTTRIISYLDRQDTNPEQLHNKDVSLDPPNSYVATRLQTATTIFWVIYASIYHVYYNSVQACPS